MKILLLLLFPLCSLAQYNCVEYDLRIDKEFSATDSVCYVSVLTKSKRKHILMVSTDRYEARFAVLKSLPVASNLDEDGRGVYNGVLMLAVIVGRPDQLYAIREESRNLITGEYYYFFSVRPIEQNERMNKPISGRVLEVSNREVCAVQG